MALDYALVIGIIGVPIAVFLMKMVPALDLMFEIVESIMMLPV